jgi:UDP-N-acetylglucosamine transferase subunit ALG13
VIFVTVGTQLGFDRLIMAVDAWAMRNNIQNVVGQIGSGRYKPTFIDAHQFIPPDVFRTYQNNAQLLISHAGMGAILGALEGRKPLIIMPRKADLGEHRNDHQLATAKHFRETPGIYVADNGEELNQLLEKSVELLPGAQISTGAPSELVNALVEFLADERQEAMRVKLDGRQVLPK